MSEDPLDDLLNRAFADDREESANIDVAPRVMARIRAGRRLRNCILGGAALAGLTIALAFLEGAAVALTEQLISMAREPWPNDPLLMALAAAAAATWLLLMEENAV